MYWKIVYNQYQKFKAEPVKAKGWLTAGQYKIKSKTDTEELAAYDSCNKYHYEFGCV